MTILAEDTNLSDSGTVISKSAKLPRVRILLPEIVKYKPVFLTNY